MSEWKIGKLKPEDEPGTISQQIISKVETQTAREIFKDKAKKPDQLFMRIYVKRNGKDVPVGNISMPDNPGAVHPKSNAGQFLTTYGKTPKAGVKVQVKVTADGFWQLVL